MTTITGILSEIKTQERSDAAIIGSKKVTLKKGEGQKILGLRGHSVTVEAKEGEWNGKTTYLAQGAVTSTSGGIVEPVNNLAPQQQRTGYTDTKQESIIFQGVLKSMVEFAKYTSDMPPQRQDAEFKRLLSLTYRSARLASNPDLFRPNPNRPNFDVTALSSGDPGEGEGEGCEYQADDYSSPSQVI